VPPPPPLPQHVSPTGTSLWTRLVVALAQPYDRPYRIGVTSVRFLRSTDVRKEPRLDAAKVGAVRGGTRSVPLRAQQGDRDCVRWIEIAPRGHFRLRGDVCNFPPIRLIFPKQGLKGTPLAGQNALKLGTHCQRNDKEYAEYPVREHAAYEVLNMLTDISCRSRLATVTYVPVGEEKDSVTKIGLLIEDESDMSKRNGMRIATIRGGSFADMDPGQMTIMSVFAYFLGNTDWSLWSLHNVRMMLSPDGRYVPVPYDFDYPGPTQAKRSRYRATAG